MHSIASLIACWLVNVLYLAYKLATRKPAFTPVRTFAMCLLGYVAFVIHLIVVTDAPKQ